MEVLSVKKWVAAGLVGVMVVGCSGGGGGNAVAGGGGGGGAGGGGGGGVVSPVVALPDTKAHVSLTILSGQGRRSLGSMFAEITGITLTSNSTDLIPPNLSIDGGLPSVRAQLDGYSVNKIDFSQDLAKFSSSSTGKTGEKTFQELNLALDKTFVEQADGSLAETGAAPILPTFNLLATLFPGRYTNITTYLNDAEFIVDPVTGLVTFDEAAWEIENFKSGLTMLRASLSDFVSFDISAMAVADRPTLSATGLQADKFMVTGDQMGISRGFSSTGNFDLIDEGFITSGVLTNSVVIPGVGTSDTANGTYNVTEPDPRLLPPDVALLSAVQGIWRPYEKLTSGITGNAFIAFPSSTGGPYQTVAFNVNAAGKITNLWFGTATATSPSGTFTMYPVKYAGTLDKTGAPTVKGSFKVTNSFTFTPLDKFGAPVQFLGSPVTITSPLGGTFAAPGAPASWSFGATGNFLVFR